MADGQGHPPGAGTAQSLGALAYGAFPVEADARQARHFVGPAWAFLAMSVIAVLLCAAAMSVLGLLVVGSWRLLCAIPVPPFIAHLAHTVWASL